MKSEIENMLRSLDKRRRKQWDSPVNHYFTIEFIFKKTEKVGTLVLPIRKRKMFTIVEGKERDFLVRILGYFKRHEIIFDSSVEFTEFKYMWGFTSNLHQLVTLSIEAFPIENKVIKPHNVYK